MNQSTNTTETKIIRLEGHVRMGEAVDNLRARVEENVSLGKVRMLISMDKVTSLDSSGIGVLVRSLTLARQKGGTIKLVSLPQSVAQTLRVTGVLKLFEVFEDEPSALASFNT